jgi:hypothetical protein
MYAVTATTNMLVDAFVLYKFKYRPSVSTNDLGTLRPPLQCQPFLFYCCRPWQGNTIPCASYVR